MAALIEYKKFTPAIGSTALLRAYELYMIQVDLATHAKDRALDDKSNRYLLKLGLDIAGKPRGSRREDLIQDYFDGMQRIIMDNAVLNLVAVFEKEVHALATQASGRAKQVVGRHYDSNQPYAASIENFVKNANEDINNLKGFCEIADACMSRSLSSDLNEIINYRNRLAHGKRFGKEIGKSVQEVLETLDQALATIRGNNTCYPRG